MGNWHSRVCERQKPRSSPETSSKPEGKRLQSERAESEVHSCRRSVPMLAAEAACTLHFVVELFAPLSYIPGYRSLWNRHRVLLGNSFPAKRWGAHASFSTSPAKCDFSTPVACGSLARSNTSARSKSRKSRISRQQPRFGLTFLTTRDENSTFSTFPSRAAEQPPNHFSKKSRKKGPRNAGTVNEAKKRTLEMQAPSMRL